MSAIAVLAEMNKRHVSMPEGMTKPATMLDRDQVAANRMNLRNIEANFAVAPKTPELKSNSQPQAQMT